MQPNRRTGFGELLSRGWKIWAGSLSASFPAMLLCGALPALVIAVTAYYCALVAFRPAFQLVQTILQSVLAYGFDECHWISSSCCGGRWAPWACWWA